MSGLAQSYVRWRLQGKTCWAGNWIPPVEKENASYFYADVITWWLGVRLCLTRQ